MAEPCGDLFCGASGIGAGQQAAGPLCCAGNGQQGLGEFGRVAGLDLNQVVWKSVKGEDAMMPTPRCSVFLRLEPRRDDKDA